MCEDKAQRDERHHDDCPRPHQKKFSHHENKTLQWIITTPLHAHCAIMLWWKWIISAFCRLDGADVRCLPPRCGREPGLQEPGSHHHPRRGKGPGVNLLVRLFCPYVTWSWPTAPEGDVDCGVLTHLYFGTHSRAQEDQGKMFQAPKTDKSTAST